MFGKFMYSVALDAEPEARRRRDLERRASAVRPDAKADPVRVIVSRRSLAVRSILAIRRLAESGLPSIRRRPSRSEPG